MPTLAHQLHPARCKGVYSVEDVLGGNIPSHLIAEEKKDDIRYLFQIRPNRATHNFLTSRRISVVTNEFVEKQDKLPHYRDFEFPASLANTVLDGGIHGEGISTDTVHQIALGQGSYALWDVLFIAGRDVRNSPYYERRGFLEELKRRKILPEWMELIPNSKDPKGYLETIFARNGEGLVLKDPGLIYGEGWFKVKKEESFDVIVWNYEDSTSAKYGPHGWIKSVCIAQYVVAADFVDHPNLIQADDLAGTCLEDRRVITKGGITYVLLDVGRASGMNEEVRADISENRDTWLGQVIEVESQLRLKSGKFRHPRYSRQRGDKNPEDCVWDGTINKAKDSQD